MKTSKGISSIIILFVILLLSIGFFYTVRNSTTRSDKNMVNSKDTNKNEEYKVVYSYNDDFFINSSEGTEPKQLPISKDESPILLHNATEKWIFFKILPNEFLAYNYLTNKENRLKLSHPDYATLSITNIEVSPNGEKILFNVSYSSKCDVEGNRQDPCPQLDLYPEYKSGTYVYDANTDTNTYIGHLFRSTQWSPDSKFIYTTEGTDYYEYKLANGVFMINASDGKATKLQDIPAKDYFYFYVYPLLNDNEAIKAESVRINRAAVSNGTLKLIKNGEEFDIDSGSLGTNSHSKVLSPDRKHLIYTKDGDIYLYDIESREVSVILDDPKIDFINPTPAWISNSKFLVRKDTNLVIVDITDKNHVVLP